MKIKAILESNTLDILKKLKTEYETEEATFKEIRDTLSRRDIALLSHMLKRRNEKKAYSSNIPEETLAVFRTLGLLDSRNRMKENVGPFLNWVTHNPSNEQEFADKRADADDALSRGHLKRDDDWTDPKQKRARKIAKSLTDEEKNIFRKIYNRFIRKRTKNLAKMWGDMPATELVAMQNRGIMDEDGNLTEMGEFVINYYMLMKDDPDGLDRVSKSQRVGNYGTARKRREQRSKTRLDKLNKRTGKNY